MLCCKSHDRRSAAEEEEAQRTGGFYSQPGPSAKKDAAGNGGGGVGKYLGGGGVTVLPKLPAGNGVGPVPHPKESASLQQQAVEGKKKVAPGAPAKSQFKDFSGW